MKVDVCGVPWLSHKTFMNNYYNWVVLGKVIQTQKI